MMKSKEGAIRKAFRLSVEEVNVSEGVGAQRGGGDVCYRY